MQIRPEILWFTDYLDGAFNEIITRLKKINLTDVELAQLSAQIDFLDELYELGLYKQVNKYFSQYDDYIFRIVRQAQNKGLNISSLTISQLELVRELDKSMLLKSVDAWSSRFESVFIKQIIAGKSIKDIVSAMEDIPLTDAQLGTVLNTSFSEFDRITVKKIYEDEPDQRFKYTGGIIPTSSKQCRWLIENQKPEGYTTKEIENGIETPYVDKHGEQLIINWSGRIPNFNCIHRWVAVLN